MVVNSPREFPLTRENVILIRQCYHFQINQISNLLPKIYCHFVITRPGNENLVALQPTVSGIFETLKLLWFFFSGDLRGPIGDLCLSWRPSLFVSRGFKMQSQAFKMFRFFQERELSSYDGYTRGRWDWNCEFRDFLFSLQMFAWVQEQLCCTTEQHWLSALVRTVFQNMCQCSILTRFNF